MSNPRPVGRVVVTSTALEVLERNRANTINLLWIHSDSGEDETVIGLADGSVILITTSPDRSLTTIRLAE